MFSSGSGEVKFLLNALLVPIAVGLSIFGIAAATAQSAATGDFNGRVDVGGRKIHLECEGAGAPAVILVSGYRNNAEIWTVEPGPGLTPVFVAVAQFTRVCAYDRPGTILDADHLSRSDRAPTPRTAEAITAELHATLDPPTAFWPDAFEAAWREGQRRLAALRPDARYQIAAESDHYIQIEQPVLVVDAIRAVVDAARDPASWTRERQLQPAKTAGGSPAPSANVADADPGSGEFAGLIDVGGGRKMYLECRGAGSPTVVLVAGLKAFAGDWNSASGTAPTVFSGVANVTRVCAYDRPGTPVGELPSRSDPVRQPTTAADAVADLHALLGAAREPAPYVLVGHSYGGLIATLYARTYPRDAGGLVLVDALAEGLQEAETPEQWATQRVLMEGDIRESLALYPALERIDPDRSFDQVRAAPPLSPLPLIVLSADRPWGPQIPALIADGTLPADVPADFGYITDAAQKKAQDRLAALVPGARHITNTNSGHEVHKEQPRLVTDAIIEVVDAVRAGTTSLAQ